MIAERFDAFLFDLDGVVYLGDELLPGSEEALARLRETGKEVRFLTNDPRPTRAQVRRRLAGIGVVGVEVVDRGPCEAVVVGSDEHVSYSHIRQASRYIFEGARFVATNADGSFPSPKGPLPGTGAIVEAVRVTTDEKPIVVGKPFPPMYDMALKDLSTARERTVMIGDTLDSDIAGAKRAGISGVLVSQEYTHDNADGGDSMVGAVIQNLTGLFDSGITTFKKAGR